MCCVWLPENTGCKNSPSAHHCTTFSGCIFATKAYIDNWKNKLLKQQYFLHMSSQYGELQPANGWDRLASLWHPSKFQRVLHLGFVTAPPSLNGGQPNFARCLAISWAGILYAFLGLLSLNGILPGAKFTLHLSLAFSYIGSVTAQHSSSGHQPNCSIVQGMELQNFRSSFIFSRSNLRGWRTPACETFSSMWECDVIL